MRPTLRLNGSTDGPVSFTDPDWDSGLSDRWHTTHLINLQTPQEAFIEPVGLRNAAHSKENYISKAIELKMIKN